MIRYARQGSHLKPQIRRRRELTPRAPKAATIEISQSPSELPAAPSTEEPSSPADIAGAPPLPESPHSPPLEDAILSVIDPPELRPRASRAPTPPPQRQGFGRGPSAAIIASPRNVVIEPVPRVARTTSSQEVEELFEEAKTPPGAPPAAEDEGTFKY